MFPPVQRRRRKRKERRGHIRRQSEKHCFKEVNHRMGQVQTGRLVHTPDTSPFLASCNFEFHLTTRFIRLLFFVSDILSPSSWIFYIGYLIGRTEKISIFFFKSSYPNRSQSQLSCSQSFAKVTWEKTQVDFSRGESTSWVCWSVRNGPQVQWHINRVARF